MSAIRLMTYNVRYFAHATRGIASTREGIARIAKAIASLAPAPDVVCLQEVETRSLRSSVLRAQPSLGGATQLDHLMRELGAELAARGEEPFTAHYFPAHSYGVGPRALYTTGLATLVRQSVRVVGHNVADPHDITHRARLPRLKQTRVCGLVTLEDATGERIDVFNTHLSLPAFFSREFWTNPSRLGYGKNQLAEARELADFVERTSASKNFVLVGDFNSRPGSPVDAYLREARGFRSALATLRPPAPGFATAGFMNLRMHIDHVYASPSMRFMDLEGTHGFDERGAFSGASDHVPIIARCSVASADPALRPPR